MPPLVQLVLYISGVNMYDIGFVYIILIWDFMGLSIDYVFLCLLSFP